METLRPFHTFKTGHKASQILIATTKEQLSTQLSQYPDAIILGGGSNVLFVKDQSNAVIIVDMKGVEVLEENESSVFLKIAAGEVWHEVVLWSLEQGYGGLENLSLIPGKCGAAPIQNIGAYGVELSELLSSVTCIDKLTRAQFTLDKSRCGFGYRDSIFKKEYKDQYVITSITLRLTKSGHHKMNTSYGAIQDVLDNWKIKVPTLKDISAAVIKIRQGKLPDPLLIPNAGSFFKNPIISSKQYQDLLKKYPDLPCYRMDEELVKVPAGWLIDQRNWKGIMIGQTGVHPKQALVLVNHGEEDGRKIYELSEMIKQSVIERYGIELEREVNVF